MDRNVIGLFDDYVHAQAAVSDLLAAGFSRDQISIMASNARGEHKAELLKSEVAKDESSTMSGTTKGAIAGGIGGLALGLAALAIPGIGPIVAVGPIVTALGGAGIGAVAGGAIGALTDMGVPETEAQTFAEAVRRGGTLVAVRTSDAYVDTAVNILTQHGAVDINERAEYWRQKGWTGFSTEAKPYSAQELAREHEELAKRVEEIRVPVVQEEVQVGKREVARGGVRVFTRVIETPVAQPVELHEEQVTVERHSVDRPVTGTEAGAFREAAFEVTAKGEEAVVGKRARVVEEVVVSKTAGERVETVKDTVRHSEVDVQNISAPATTTIKPFESYDADFRQNFASTFARKGQTYERLAPAYRYGYDLGVDPYYGSQDWSAVEPEARKRWEQQQPGTWERVKDAARYAWERVAHRRA